MCAAAASLPCEPHDPEDEPENESGEDSEEESEEDEQDRLDRLSNEADQKTLDWTRAAQALHTTTPVRAAIEAYLEQKFGTHTVSGLRRLHLIVHPDHGATKRAGDVWLPVLGTTVAWLRDFDNGDLQRACVPHLKNCIDLPFPGRVSPELALRIAELRNLTLPELELDEPSAPAAATKTVELDDEHDFTVLDVLPLGVVESASATESAAEPIAADDSGGGGSSSGFEDDGDDTPIDTVVDSPPPPTSPPETTVDEIKKRKRKRDADNDDDELVAPPDLMTVRQIVDEKIKEVCLDDPYGPRSFHNRNVAALMAWCQNTSRDGANCPGCFTADKQVYGDQYGGDRVKDLAEECGCGSSLHSYLWWMRPKTNPIGVKTFKAMNKAGTKFLKEKMRDAVAKHSTGKGDNRPKAVRAHIIIAWVFHEWAVEQDRQQRRDRVAWQRKRREKLLIDDWENTMLIIYPADNRHEINGYTLVHVRDELPRRMIYDRYCVHTFPRYGSTIQSELRRHKTSHVMHDTRRIAHSSYLRCDLHCCAWKGWYNDHREALREARCDLSNYPEPRAD